MPSYRLDNYNMEDIDKRERVDCLSMAVGVLQLLVGHHLAVQVLPRFRLGTVRLDVERVAASQRSAL